MTISVDTSIARVTPGATPSATGTTASFTPAVGDLLVVCAEFDNSSTAVTFSDSQSGTWSQVLSDGGSVAPTGSVESAIGYRLVSSATSMTVTATCTAAFFNSIKVYRISGGGALSVGATGFGGSATANVTPTAYSSTAANSLMVVTAATLTATAGASSSDLTVDTHFNVALDDLASLAGFKTLGAPGSQTFNLNVTASPVIWHWAAIEVVEASNGSDGTPPPSGPAGTAPSAFGISLPMRLDPFAGGSTEVPVVVVAQDPPAYVPATPAGAPTFGPRAAPASVLLGPRQTEQYRLFYESFDKGTSAGYGPDLAWQVVTGANFATNTSRGTNTGATFDFIRASYQTNTDDQFVECEYVVGDPAVDRSVGLMVRYGAAADTGYYSELNQFAGTYGLSRRVAGTLTTLVPLTVLPGGITPGAGRIFRLEAIGSTIRGYWLGQLLFSVTDTGVTTGKCAGSVMFNGGSVTQIENFRYGDYAAAEPTATLAFRAPLDPARSAPAAQLARPTADPSTLVERPQPVDIPALVFTMPAAGQPLLLHALVEDVPPAVPEVFTRLTLPPTATAPAALVERSTADPAPDTLPQTPDAPLPGRWPLQAPTAVVQVARDVTPPQASDQPGAPLVARAGGPPPPAAAPILERSTADPAVVDSPRGPLILTTFAAATSTARPVLVTAKAAAEARPTALILLPAFVQALTLAAWVGRSTADPVADTLPQLDAARALVLPLPAPAALVLAVRDVTPLQASSQPPILTVVPVGWVRPPLGGTWSSRSTADPTDPVVGLKTNVTPVGVQLPYTAPAATVLQVRDLTALQASAQPTQPVIARGIVLPALAGDARAWRAPVDQGAVLLPAVVVAAVRAAQLAPIRAGLYVGLVEDIAQPEPWIIRAPAGPSSAAAPLLVRAAVPLEVPRPTATLSVLAGRWPLRALLVVLVRPQGREFIPIAYAVLWPGQTTAATLAAGATGAPSLAGYPVGIATLSAGSTGAATIAAYPGGAPTLSGG